MSQPGDDFNELIGLRIRIAQALVWCDTYTEHGSATVPISTIRDELDPDWEDRT